MATTETPAPSTSLSLFGNREEVKELGLRLRTLMPSAQKFTEAEAMSVAQLAVAHGLDPFNGELWGIKSEAGKWYGIMVGVKGLRKCADRQAREQGFVYWTEYAYVSPQTYAQPSTAVVVEFYIRDTQQIQAYAAALKALRDATMPYEDAREMLGKRPVTVGIGIATPSESSKMKLHARAIKRAEATALKMRFNVSFGAGVITDADAIEGEVAEIVEQMDDDTGTNFENLVPPEIDQPAPTAQETIDTLFPAERSATSTTPIATPSTQPIPQAGPGKTGSRALPRTEAQGRLWTLQQKEALVKDGLAETIEAAKAVLDLSDLPGEKTGLETIKSWVKHYNDFVVEGDDTGTAADKANIMYRDAKDAPKRK